MAKQPTLKAEKRTSLGRKVKQLRRNGILPANVFSRGLESISVQINAKEFENIYSEVGETGVVSLELEGKSLPVLVSDIQVDPVTEAMVHIDLRKVDLNVKIITHVPLVLVGEAPVEKIAGIFIAQQIDELEVEALPTDLPEAIEIDISILVEAGQPITVADLKLPKGIVAITDEEVILVIARETKEEVEEEVVVDSEAEAESEAEATDEAQASNSETEEKKED